MAVSSRSTARREIPVAEPEEKIFITWGSLVRGRGMGRSRGRGKGPLPRAG